MVLMQTPIANFGEKAPDFVLPDPEGKMWALNDIKGANGLLVMFICNHCPYVKGIINRLILDIQKIQEMQVGCVAINANDPIGYPEDSAENMLKLSKELGFTFPYLIDKSQMVAKAYGAVCTPDFFGYNSDLALQYRGRLDEFGKNAAPNNRKSELVEAMQLIVNTGKGPDKQQPSMGCSIKWHD